MKTKELIEWIEELASKKEIYKFYKSREWNGDKDREGLRNEVLREQHYECQMCLFKSPKEYSRADTVHHVQFVRKHPELALSKYYIYQGKRHRNLIAVCKDCHNKLHPEKHRHYSEKEKFTNEERW